MIWTHFGKRTVAAVLAASTVFAVSARPVPVSAVTSLDSLQQKQSDLKKQGQDLDSQLAKLKNDKAKQQQYKDALDAKIVNLENQIDSQTNEIQQLDASILKNEAAIAGKQKDIDADFQKLKQRVYALYLTGEASNLEIVLQAKSIMDLADKSEMIQVISKHDMGLMNTLKTDINSIKAQKAAIEKDRKTVSDARTAQQQDQDQLKAMSAEAAKVLVSLGANQQQVEDEQAKCRIDQQTAQTAVAQWLANYYAEQKAAASVSSQTSSRPDTSSSKTPVPKDTPSDPSTPPSSTPSKPESPSGGSSGGGKGQGILPVDRVTTMISVAQQYLKYPYVWGGSTPDSSFDCSGYVSWVINHSGWDVGRLGVDGLYGICSPVSSADARPGDLIFYNYTYGGLPRSHVGIYLGGNKAIQCDDPGVEFVDITTYYWSHHFDSFGRLPV